MLARWELNGQDVWDSPVYLVCLVYSVCLVYLR